MMEKEILKRDHPIRFGVVSLFLFTIISLNTIAQVITVKQDGSGDFTVIQQAINASDNGDTVLVYPGTYFENINFNGKSITLASLNLTTGEDQYIHQTIIDGNYSGTCITIDQGEGAHICGFTVTHGTGTPGFYPVGNVAGGIFFVDNTPSKVENCVIKDNEVEVFGGGIAMATSKVLLSGVVIKDNYAYRNGGGLWTSGNDPVTTVEFDTVNRCSIFSNYSSRGADIYKTFSNDTLHLVLDTFSVLQPDAFHIWESNTLGNPDLVMELDIWNGKIEAVAADLYVSPSGNNDNTGLSPDQPLKNINYAMSKIIPSPDTRRTIYLADGKYSPYTNGEKFPITLRSYIDVQGESRDATILDADSTTYVIKADRLTHDYKVSDLTVERGYGSEIDHSGNIEMEKSYNGEFVNLNIRLGSNDFCSASSTGSSTEIIFRDCEIYDNKRGWKAIRLGTVNTPELGLQTDTLTLESCRIYNNGPGNDPESGAGGAVGMISTMLQDSAGLVGRVINCEIVENIESRPPGYLLAGAVLTSYNVKSYIVNSTIANNDIPSNPNNHAIGIQESCQMYIYNSIVSGNHPRQLGIGGDGSEPSHMYVYYSDIEGGPAQVFNPSPGNMLHYDESNIEESPRFIITGDHKYALQSSSPCIDAGTLDLPPEVYLPDYDLAGNPRIYGAAIDMGAYEWFPVGVEEIKKEEKKNLLKAYPNPFRYSASISFENPTGGPVSIIVFNINGNVVSSLYDASSAPQKGTFRWDGSDMNGNPLPSGIYIIKMTSGTKQVGIQKVQLYDPRGI